MLNCSSSLFTCIICIADYVNSRVCKDFTGSAVCRDPVTGIQYPNVEEDEEDLDQLKSVTEKQTTKKHSYSNKKKSQQQHQDGIIDDHYQAQSTSRSSLQQPKAGVQDEGASISRSLEQPAAVDDDGASTRSLEQPTGGVPPVVQQQATQLNEGDQS
jgi:hypothetical protein